MRTEELKSQVLGTLSFFHIFSHPLTEFEIWKFLFTDENAPVNVNLSDIKDVLIQLKTAHKIDEKDGFYSLSIEFDAEESVNERLRRMRISIKKFRKASKITNMLKRIPSIKMIAVCNSLALNYADEESDIDLFIITEKNHIWRTRLLVLATLELFHLRPSKKNNADKICASFFISEEDLNLQKIKIDSQKFRLDIYLIYWIATMLSIYNKDDTYKKFARENSWIKNILKNWEPNELSDDFFPNPALSYIFQLPFFLTYFIPENLARKFQMAIMPKNLKRLANNDTSVIINNKMLKFHDKDRRGEYSAKWERIRYEAKK